MLHGQRGWNVLQSFVREDQDGLEYGAPKAFPALLSKPYTLESMGILAP